MYTHMRHMQHGWEQTHGCTRARTDANWCVTAENPHYSSGGVYLREHVWHIKWSLCIMCIIKTKSVDYIQPETPTQTHTRLPHSTRQTMVMLTLSPSDSASRWVFLIWLKQFLPVLLWRVLHLVKSHYYGNVRVLEIMARWEQLDCLWHNNPTLSISSASSCSHSLYCILPSLYLTVSLSPLRLKRIFLFHEIPARRKAILWLKSNITVRELSALLPWPRFNSV